MNTPVPPIVMVCTVGGTPEPLRNSINFHKPSHVIYIASPESRTTIRSGIEDGLDWRIGDTHVVTLNDFQDIVQCVMDMRQGIAEALRAMSLPENTPLIADITGGTKIMSAALALVMMEFKSRFSYVGGGVRTKEGLGVVQSGTEFVVQDANPWDVLALREARALARSFNHAQFTDALTTAHGLAEHMDDQRRQKFYSAIADMVEGYALWDSFDHKAALGKLRQAESRLTPYTYNAARLSKLTDTVKKDLERLEALQQDAQFLRSKDAPKSDAHGKVYLLDLLANAQRRAEAGHYDDAVARLYSAIEKCAKIALRVHHGIDNSQIRLEQIPKTIREEWRSQLDADGVARVGLEKSFLLLDALGDPLGLTFRKRQTALQADLQARNVSLLAHGYVPIGKDKYDKLLAAALDFLQADMKTLPTFPHIDWKALLP